MTNVRHKQEGASFLSMLTIILVAGVFFSVAFKLYPAYMDYMTVDSVLSKVILDSDELRKDPKSLKRDLNKKWNINQIRLPSQESLIIRRKEGVITFYLDYEVRVPMFFNVDAMVKFEKQYEAIAP
ncbi:MAG: DUF4845 domain-containing protein [Neptuniibacter sp.]